MDINEYYQTMGARPESDAWEMPIYNTVNYKPITGPGRQPPKKSGSFTAPVYNYQGKPILSNKDPSSNQNNNPVYRIEVFRPGVIPGQQFKAPRYNYSSGKPIINEEIQENGNQGVYRPSQLKKNGIPSFSARKESILGWGETRKVFLSNSFAVQAPIPIGSFTKVSGLEIEWELETYREGGDNGGEHIFPSQIKNSRLVLEYGIGFIDPLWQWINTTKTGIMVKLPMMIYLYNELRLPVKLWMVLNALPVKYSAADFDAMASEVAITRLEFIHSGLLAVL
ncbi:MAG: phage tail protein [Heliobacteriaceae bacterium]|nr:phage tail protein [Heliobacteriaceae bacterium]